MGDRLLDSVEWAQREFGECRFGDVRRTRSLQRMAVAVANNPSGSTPDQLEEWKRVKSAYRFIDCDDVSFQGIIEPHGRHTREACRPGQVMLILNDTTEIDYTSRPQVQGLGPIGNGRGRGFFVHSGLMVDAASGRIAGMAGQEIFHRNARTQTMTKNERRRSAQRESAVWGRLIERIGAPPPGVTWIHVCDRGADNYEAMLRAIHQQTDFVIRAAQLHRKVLTVDGRSLKLSQVLDELPVRATRELQVRAQPGRTARKAAVELRFGEVLLPRPKVCSAWTREHAPAAPLRLRVVEVREVAAPQGQTPLRWVLYTTRPVESVAEADEVVAYYDRRPIIEDYHKCYKTGCGVEDRQYETAARLERVAGLLSVVAVRLLQMRTAAVETPEQPASELAPTTWIDMLQNIGKLPPGAPTIRQFVRALARLGGHLGRKCDGEPGWITLWRGHTKLQLMLRGARTARPTRNCG